MYIEINLSFIPYLLPSYLPEHGGIHLDCLKSEIENHLPSETRSKIEYFFILIIFIAGYILGSIWYNWTYLWYFFLIPFVIANSIILVIWFRKYFVKSYIIWRWVKKQQEIKE